MKKLLVLALSVALGMFVAVLPAPAQVSGSRSGQKVIITDGTRNATVRDTGASDSVNVSVVDASGNQITSFGGGGAASGVYAEDTAHSSGDNGAAQLGVRNDTAATLTSADGDYSPIAVTARGGTIVEGPAAHDAVFAGNPVPVGGRASSSGVSPTNVAAGDTVRAWHSLAGAYVTAPELITATISTGGANISTMAGTSGSPLYTPVLNLMHQGSGTSWFPFRIAATGQTTGAPLLAQGPSGSYLDNSSQPAVTNNGFHVLQIDPAGNLRTAPQRPTATDILAASATVTATTGSTALITVAAGRTWVGTLCASVSGSKAAAATGDGSVQGSFLTAGTSVTPAAGTYFQVDTAIGANAATGTAGTQGSSAACTPFTVVAPAGNSVTVNYAATCTSTTACRGSFSANGVMQ